MYLCSIISWGARVREHLERRGACSDHHTTTNGVLHLTYLTLCSSECHFAGTFSLSISPLRSSIYSDIPCPFYSITSMSVRA